MTDLALSAITNAILAVFIAFLAGLSFRSDQERTSAAGLLALYLLVAALANLLGTIHHGFLEGSGHPADIPLRSVTRIVMTLGIFVFLMSTARQFLSTLGQRISLALGLVGLALISWLVATEDNFLVLVAGNLVVMLLALGLHLRGLRNGSGSWTMALAIVLTLATSMLIPLGGDGVAGLGLYGTFHVALMPAFVFFYLGGRALKRQRT
ncbi:MULTISPECIES: DUF6962 family protein [Thiorhodovibrio]|uniref:DUF6962 family protein n=1 Tax=Thiorhodovibrio TaxID=61593 RepID=UPI001911DC4E|nr:MULTISPECIES: hypothetical protein [Thiorhodovibrio]MBK5970952.1 hypothetical protein [Thiorhodovibrio winogradskyi]WPL10682.1 hypothetical protein Thiosp_00399 [Thiorhodovibrio litoralis]